MNEILLNRLLRHFREPNVGYNEIQRQQVEYVYESLCLMIGNNDLKAVFGLLEQLEKELRNRHLSAIYQHLKIHNMLDSGHYDFGTAHLPINLTPFDKGWKL